MACRQSTSTDKKVPMEEYPTCNENQRHQQLFDPRLFIISGLRNTTAHFTLFKYIKSMTGGDLKTVTLLGEGRAVVEVGKDISGFQKLKSKIRRCKLEGRQFKILRVYACDSILVSGIAPVVTRDTILLYFESVRRSGGGEVSDVALCKATNSAVVTFLNPGVIGNVVQREHVLESQQLTVKKYFPQIDMKNMNTLSGTVSLQSNDEEEKSSSQHHVKPVLVKRLCTSCKVDDDIMQFIRIGVHFQELESKLDELHAEIEWDTGSDRVTIWKKADSSYVKGWTNSCETVLDEFCDRFDKFFFILKESVKNAVSLALPRLVEIIPPEKALCKQVEENQELLVVYLEEERVSVVQSVVEFLENVEREEIRKMYQKETVGDICHSHLLFLKHIGFVEKMKEKNPELEVTVDLEKDELNFEGPKEQFTSAMIIYCQTVKEINHKILDLPSSIASIISTGPGKRYINKLLVQKKISAIILSEADSPIRLVAGTSDEYSRALNCVCDSVHEAKVPFPSGHDFIFERDEWKEISAENLNSQLIHLNIDHAANLIVLQGATDIVEKSEKEITEYIESQRIQELKKIVTPGMARFVKENLSKEINDIEARLKIDQVSIEFKIRKSLNYDFIICRGTKSGLPKCEKSISELCRMVTKKEKELSSPGLSQLLFSENGQRNLKVIEIENSVVIEMTKRTREDVKETSQTEVQSLREELKEEKKNWKRLSLVEEDRSKCTSDIKAVESTYDLCNFTTKEGLRVSWKYGNIADETADILVNSAHSDLSNPTACGRALNKVGGPSFIQACRDQDTIQKGSVARTSGGNLSCKFVLHAVCCRWDSHQGKAEELLHKLVKSILRKCERRRATSLAMPAIGTGKHMFPEDVVFRVLREEFKVFSFSETTFTMRDIRIVVFAKQLATQPTPIRSIMVRSRRISFRSVHVSLLEGDIAQHPAAAIINMLPRDLQLSNGGGVCKSILRAGGQAVQQELNLLRLQKSSPDMVYVTTTGSISNAQKILHIVPASTDVPSLQASIGACLNRAKLLSLGSVSVSAIGTGPFGVTPRNSAEIILSAAKKFSTFNFPLDINIVVFQRNMVQDFETVIQENATVSMLSAPHVGARGSARDSSTRSKAAYSSSSQSASTARVMPLNTGEPKQTVNLQVFARSSETIDACFDAVDTFVKNQTTTKEIEHEKAFEVFVAHWSKVEKLARDHDVKITCERSSIALIEGFVTNVSDCKEELMRLINESVEEERKVNQLRYISKNIQWYFFQAGRAVEYDSELNGLLETASMENKQVLEITKFGDPYEIDLTLMMEKNTKSGQTERIKRKLIGESDSDVSLPRTWDPQPRGQIVQLVSLSSALPEYQKVLELFISRGGRGSLVTKIERIQNPRLYSAFLAAKKSMNGADNEMQLFHGTSASNTESINANNFSRSFAGVNGVAYGNGVYFARDSSYSLRYSQLHGSSGGFSQMYVAKVLVGQYTTGSKGIKAPPNKNDPVNPGVRYDSVVDNSRNPSIFVIFVDNHCYPEYLITFICTSRA